MTLYTELATKTPPSGKYESQPVVSSTTDTDAVVAATNEGRETFTYDIPGGAEVSEDGRFTSVATESEQSERNTLLARVEAAERAASVGELKELEGLTEEAEQERQAVLKEMEGTDSEEQEAGAGPEAGSEQQANTPTAEEIAAIERIAQNDAIALARARALASDPTGLAMQYATAQAQVVSDYQQKLAFVRSQHSDYDSVVAEVARNDVPLSHTVSEALMTVGGPELVYKLMKSPSKARELAALPDHVAVAKIGQMAAELNVRPQPARQQSNLRPTKPVGSSMRNGPSISDPDIPYSEFYKLREKQQKERYRR